MSLSERAIEERLAELRDAMATRRRPVRVVRKSDFRHQRVIGLLLKAITFGGQNTYLSHYVTTLGHTIFVPDDFDDWPAANVLEILRHELVHVEQFERYTWLGMIVIYGFFPLPAFLAYGRARLEWEAYRETLRAVAEIEGLPAARRMRGQITQRFTGPDYGWMWPFPKSVHRWIDEELEAIERERA
jgi:hypothetical protein